MDQFPGEQQTITAADKCHPSLSETSFDWLGTKYRGKVRDVYDTNGSLVLIATDRQSAFDISWCSIPLKGQILTQLSVWWFEQVKSIVPNHIIASPDPNVIVAKKLKMFPIEVVVRDFLAGSTETSIWVNYRKGQRNFCGNVLPDGMRKNCRLPHTIITPTTKGEHDRPVTPDELVAAGTLSADQWSAISNAALSLFKRGQEIAREHNLILVDTKYEFGTDVNGVITIGDEVHTPDSSRFWLADTYEERFKAGKEPDSLDKEFFRRWLIENGFDVELGFDSPKPQISQETIRNLSAKYVELYNRITGNKFQASGEGNIERRIESNLRHYFENLS